MGNGLRGLEGSVKWSVLYKPATTINLGVKDVSEVIVSSFYHIYHYSDQMKAIGLFTNIKHLCGLYHKNMMKIVSGDYK